MTQTTLNSRESSGPGLADRIWNAAGRLIANWRARSSLYELQMLDDHMLDDIGITRDDLTWAEYLPTSRNPISELARCRQKNVQSTNNGRRQVRRCS